MHYKIITITCALAIYKEYGKNVLTILLALALLLAGNTEPAEGKTSGDLPFFRTSGYKGSVSLTARLVFLGLDTSHGYMFNGHHYLGAGIGFFTAPVGEIPAFGHLYADYKAYLLKKNSTPTAGIQAGYCIAFKDLSGNAFQKAFELDPHIGWNWTFNHKVGLDLSVGASVFLYGTGPATGAKAMPKISIGIEF